MLHGPYRRGRKERDPQIDFSTITDFKYQLLVVTEKNEIFAATFKIKNL